MKRFAMAFAMGMAALPLLGAQAGAGVPTTNSGPTTPPTTARPPQTTTPPSRTNNNGKPKTYGANPPANPGVKTPIVDPAKGALGNHGNTPANPYEGTTR